MEKTQEQARQEILDLVADYCRTYHINNKKPYKPGDRIPYASRGQCSGVLADLRPLY